MDFSQFSYNEEVGFGPEQLILNVSFKVPQDLLVFSYTRLIEMSLCPYRAVPTDRGICESPGSFWITVSTISHY